jgi:hypothetical protein
VTPLIQVRNNGTITAEGISIVYTLTGQGDQTYNDQLFVLEPGNTAEIELPAIDSPDAGSKELHIQIVPADDEYDKLNNNMVHRWKKLPIQSNVLQDDFEDGIASDVWTIDNPDGTVTWDTAYVIQADGEMGYAAWMDFFDYNPIASQADRLISPWIMPDGIDVVFGNPTLTFDLYYRKRTSNSFTQDTLAIIIHPSCLSDAEPFEIFRKGGTELYTNPNLLSDAFPESADEWQETALEIEFADFLNSGEGFYIEFLGINRRSSNLLIDNVNLEFSELLSSDDIPKINVNMYPNPAQDAVFFNWSGNYDKASLRLHDLQGRLVGVENVVVSGEPVQLPALVSGLYLATLSFDDGNERVVKLVIN